MVTQFFRDGTQLTSVAQRQRIYRVTDRRDSWSAS
jgi:hypothetical protein